MTELPLPLVPSDVDLTDFLFMPVEVQRVLSSDTWIGCSVSIQDKARGFSIANLWYQSWHQKPASSIPSNDTVIARLAMCGLDEWMSYKESALKGWTLCSDGRYYHPVVAEKALEAWIEKLEQRKKSNAGNAKRWGKIFDPQSINEQIADSHHRLNALNPNARGLHKKGKSLLYETNGNPAGIPCGIPSGNPTGNPRGIVSVQPPLAVNPNIVDSKVQTGVHPTGNPPGIPIDKEGTGTGTSIKDSCAETSSTHNQPQSSEPFHLTPQSQPKLALAAPVIVLTIIQRNGKEYPVTEDFIKQMTECYPGIDIVKSLLAAKAWCFTNPGNRKTHVGMDGFLNGWIRREVDSPRKNGSGSGAGGVERGEKLSKGKWSDFEKKDYTKGVGGAEKNFSF